jgi:hypothetical protein
MLVFSWIGGDTPAYWRVFVVKNSDVNHVSRCGKSFHCYPHVWDWI